MPAFRGVSFDIPRFNRATFHAPLAPTGAFEAPRFLTDADAAKVLRVAQFNVHNLFDTVDTPGVKDEVLTPLQYQNKLSKLSLAIRDKLAGADVIALEEIENEQVLRDLLARPEIRDLGYASVVMAGNDSRGINVALLYRTSSVTLRSARQINTRSEMKEGSEGQFDPSLLFARPPLVVELTHRGAAGAAEGAQNLTLVVNHFKSKIGGHDARREAQADFVGGFVDAQRAANPKTPVIVIGDLNAMPTENAVHRLLRRSDGSQRLFDTTAGMDPADRYSYIFRGKHNQLDHVLVSDDLNGALVRTMIPHFNSTDRWRHRDDPTTPDGVSDHDPVLSEFDLRRLVAGA